MLESEFQSYLIKKIKSKFNGCLILKNDSAYMPGIPDLSILYKDKWVMLECKKSENSPKRPGQEAFISKLNDMSYAAFVYPENCEEVLHDLERLFLS